MNHEGKYIYGIIATHGAPAFNVTGIGGDRDTVTTICSSGLAAVVSTASMDHYVISKNNLAIHTKVIEIVMNSYTILPMRFCTIAETADGIKDFLKTNARVLKDMIRDIEGKVEVDIKVMWKEMKKIYEEIRMENKKIQKLWSDSHTLDRPQLVHAGELVATALEEKKAEEKEACLKAIRRNAEKHQDMETAGDEMVLHTAFLIRKNKLLEFDTAIDKLQETVKDKINIYYVGPMAPLSFVNVELHWDE